MKKIVLQVFLITFISIALGIINQIVNPNRVAISRERAIAEAVDESVFADSSEALLEPVVVEKAQLVRLMQEEEALVIDARIPDEFAQGRIPGAVNIPVDRLGEFSELLESLDKNRWIICYCDGPPCDNGKILATELFYSAGFERVGYYDAGLDDWKESEEVER